MQSALESKKNLYFPHSLVFTKKKHFLLSVTGQMAGGKPTYRNYKTSTLERANCGEDFTEKNKRRTGNKLF